MQGVQHKKFLREHRVLRLFSVLKIFLAACRMRPALHADIPGGGVRTAICPRGGRRSRPGAEGGATADSSANLTSSTGVSSFR